ncbi:MAG: hypothetical protein HY744_28495 [Deltaproteobacteria bacterium]|nr:hypothetical protein [Deltaproteobacteria bacterium]
MLYRYRHAACSIALAGAVAALGCGSDAGPAQEPADEAAEIQSALDMEDGGMSNAAEPEGFGDPQVQETPELVDEYPDSVDVQKELAKPDMQRFHVVLLWGNLPVPKAGDGAPVHVKPIDWIGSVMVDKGAIKVRRTLLFDQKDGVKERTQPNVVEFVSHTLPHVDGLLLDIAAPAGATLHFDTVALDTDIALGELEQKGRGVVPLGDGINALAYAGYVPNPSCARGFLLGHWKNAKPDAKVGRFRGRVYSADGDKLGYIKGIYGHAPKKNADLFFGKYIDIEGQPKGLLGGKYGGGEFQGLWKTIDPNRHGALMGRYSTGLVEGDGKGFFLGRWGEKCEPAPDSGPSGSGE